MILKFIIALAILATAVYSKPPNIVVIVADDLGWGDVSFHGSRQIATPNIDALASDSIIFNNYYVSPLCSPTRSALLTGYHPVQLGLQVGVIGAGEPSGLPLNLTTLPQWLRTLNYSTVGVGKWHLGFYKKSFIPTERGFDYFFGYWTGKGDYYSRELRHNMKSKNSWGIDFHRDAEHENVTKYKNIYSTDLYTTKAVNTIMNHTKKSDRPLFLYLAHQAVHGGNADDILQAPDRYIRRYSHIKNFKRRTFAGMVSALDDSVGGVMEALEKSGTLNNTIVFFTTDNGGAVTEGPAPGVRSNLPIRGSKGTLWEGGVRATGFIWSPLLPKKYVSDQLMHVTDVPVTLFRAAGGQPNKIINPKNSRIEGMNLWETLQKKLPSPRKQLLHSIANQNKWAVRSGDFKLIIKDVANKMYLPSGFNDSVHYKNITGWSPDPKMSPAGQVLTRLGKKLEIVKVIVNCGENRYQTNCSKNNQVCLFDIKKDPCEFNDISQQHPDLMKNLTKLLAQYKAIAIPTSKTKEDPRALPIHNNGRWGVWMK